MNAVLEHTGPRYGTHFVRHILSRRCARSAARSKFTLLASILLVLTTSTGCLVRSRERIRTVRPPSGYREATLNELLESLRAQEAAIITLNATVDVEPSISSQAKGEVVHYRDVRSFLLIRKPGWLRMIGLYPVVRNTAFDLTSDGEKFELYVPSKNRLVIGSNTGTRRSASALENLRPHHILDALLWRSPNSRNETAALEVVDEPTRSFYVVHILATNGNGNLELARKLWYERIGLTLARLQVFDSGGMLATDASYSNYGVFSGLSYPQNIVIDRPQDQYGLALRVTRLVFNEELDDEKFKMEPPQHATVVNLDISPENANDGSAPN